MKKRQIHCIPIPPVSHDFAMEIDRRFRTVTVEPGVDRDALLFNAGQRSVVEFIKQMASGTLVSGDAELIKPDAKSPSLLNRILGKLS